MGFYWQLCVFIGYYVFLLVIMGLKLRLWDFDVDYEFLLVIMGFYWR